MSEILRLRSLASAPEAQADFALTLLKPRQKRDVLLAALQVLAKHPIPSARPPLLQLFEQFSVDNPKRDPTAPMRRAVLDALRPIVLPADVALLARAANTYEFLPPGFREDAILLRVGALLILNELDDTLAGFEATRLLVDGFSDAMSGEPARTAARVLASQAQTLPLYLYAMQTGDAAIPEVVSECLRSLTQAPPAVIAGIVARHGKSGSSIIRIGLCDLLISHSAGPQELDYLTGSLATFQDLDAYRYLVIAMLTPRRPALTERVMRSARMETHRSRIKALLEVLSLFAVHPEIAELAGYLRQRWPAESS